MEYGTASIFDGPVIGEVCVVWIVGGRGIDDDGVNVGAGTSARVERKAGGRCRKDGIGGVVRVGTPSVVGDGLSDGIGYTTVGGCREVEGWVFVVRGESVGSAIGCGPAIVCDGTVRSGVVGGL